MARNIIQQPITAKDISDYLIDQDDFNFELKCFHACRINGLNASHGGTYEDPVTKKPRQYDIRASTVQGKLQVLLAIECKNLKASYPLVVSRVPRLGQESFHEVIVSVHPDKGTYAFLRSISETADTVRLASGRSVYVKNQLVGKSTSQIGKHINNKDFVSGEEEVYEKWSQAVASADDLVAQAASEQERRQEDPFYSVVLPVLVVANNTLWTVDYSGDGSESGKPTRANECEFFLGKEISLKLPALAYTMSHLHIFTFTGFERYLKKLKDRDYWKDLFPVQQIDEMLEAQQRDT